MSLLFQLLTVTAVIALLITLRMLVHRQIMRQRLAGRAGQDCKETECSSGCGGQRRGADQTRTE